MFSSEKMQDRTHIRVGRRPMDPVARPVLVVPALPHPVEVATLMAVPAPVECPAPAVGQAPVEECPVPVAVLAERPAPVECRVPEANLESSHKFPYR